MKNKKHIIFRFLREIGDEGVFYTMGAYPASKKEAMQIVDAAATIDRLLRVIDNIAYSEDVCLGPYDEEIEHAKAFLAQHNAHEKYCFDCTNRMCNWCNNMNMWRG